MRKRKREKRNFVSEWEKIIKMKFKCGFFNYMQSGWGNLFMNFIYVFLHGIKIS